MKINLSTFIAVLLLLFVVIFASCSKNKNVGMVDDDKVTSEEIGFATTFETIVEDFEKG